MDTKAYIERGILEAYCAGLLDIDEQNNLFSMVSLYPEIAQELNAIEAAMQQLAVMNAIIPAASTKQNIFAALGFEDEAILDINNLPHTNNDSDYIQWLTALAHLIPENITSDFYFEVLQQNASVAQTLIITKSNVPEETHSNLIESFFILEGQCECMVGEHLYKLSPGDFLEIPMHVEHDIKIVSPYVIGILQHRFV
jgi:mannose-6-phosphate isomerase-like protein (cupin superfamily)